MDPARGAARLAARRHPRPSQAGLHACRSRRWLRGDLRPWAREVLLDPATLDRGYFDGMRYAGCSTGTPPAADDDAKRIWALVMLELWHREFIDAGVGQRPALAVAA